MTNVKIEKGDWFILYGNKPNQPDYLEEIITQTQDLEHLEKAKKWAEENGYVSFRVATHGDRFTEKEFQRMIDTFKGKALKPLNVNRKIGGLNV